LKIFFAILHREKATFKVLFDENPRFTIIIFSSNALH